MRRPLALLSLALLVVGSLSFVKADDDAKTLVFDAAPEGWKPDTSKKGMMAPKLAFDAPAAEGDKEDAKVTVHFFAGMGGDIDANITRWCGMFTDAAGEKADPKTLKREKLEVNGLKVTLVELAGTYHPPTFGGPAQDAKPNARLSAAIVETEDGPWFVRMVGLEKTVAKHHDAWFKWLKSAKWDVPAKKTDEAKKPESDEKK